MSMSELFVSVKVKSKINSHCLELKISFLIDDFTNPRKIVKLILIVIKSRNCRVNIKTLTNDNYLSRKK